MKRQDNFRRMDSGWPRELDVEVVASAFSDASSGVSKSSFHHHSTTTSAQSLLSDLGAFSSVTPVSSGFGYSQKNFHISDGNLYSVLSPFQSRRSSNRPTFLRGHSCVTSTTTSTTHTGSPHDATTSTTTFQETTRPVSTTSTTQRRAPATSDSNPTVRPHTKLKFHNQSAPPPSSTGSGATGAKPTTSAHGTGNDANEPRPSSSSSASRHFKSRSSSSTSSRPETTRFESMNSASTSRVGGSDLGGTSRSSSWFETRFGEPMFTDRFHSESGDSLLSKRLKCHQQQHRSSTTSSMDMEEEEEEEKDHLKEEFKHDTSSSGSRHPHRRRLFDEHLGDWGSEEISLSSSKRSSSSSYRRRFSSSSMATTDKWDMDDDDVVYDRPLNLCMADRPRKQFSSSASTGSSRHQRPDLDSASSTSKLTIADSDEDDEDGDTFPFGSSTREFRRDRKLNFSNLFDDFHSSIRSRRSRSNNTSAPAEPPQPQQPPPTKECASSELDIIARPKVEVKDDGDEDMFDRHSVFNYGTTQPRVLDLSTKRRLSQGGGGGGSCSKTSAFIPFGQKRSNHQTIVEHQPEVQNVFHASVGASGSGRSPVIVQQDSASYEIPSNLSELRSDWKTAGSQQHKRFPQMSEMFENLRLQDDDIYQSAADRYQRYQVLRERLMETHPEMFVGWEERDRFPLPSQQHHQSTTQQRRTDIDTPLSPPNLYQPDLYGPKDSLDCSKLHRPPSSSNQRPRSWDLPHAASYTQSCSPAGTPTASCTIMINSDLPDQNRQIAKSESADACLQQSSSSTHKIHHSGSSQSCYNIPITTSATFPMCVPTDQQQMNALGNVNVVSQQQKQQWIPYSQSSQILPTIQPTVIRVTPCTGDGTSYVPPQSVPSTDLKSRPPTPSTSGGRGVSKSKPLEPKIKTEIGGGVISHSRYKTRQRSASNSKVTTHHHNQDNQMSQQQLQPSTSHNQYNNDISICKFKLIKGVNPVLEEKKSFFVPQQRAASAQQLFSSHQQISGMGDRCQHASRDSSCPPLSSGGVTVGFAHHHPHRAQSTSTSGGIVKSASTGTAVPSTDREILQLSTQSLAGDQSSCTTAAVPLANKFQNFKIHVGSQEEVGRKMAIGCSSGTSGAASGSGGAKRLRRRSRKALAREKLEATFREQGFLIKTQQVSSAEGAVYCKFRQLKKFTRYLFKSWKDYLPKDLDEMSAAEGGQMPPVPPNAVPPFTFSNSLVSNQMANPDPS